MWKNLIKKIKVEMKVLMISKKKLSMLNLQLKKKLYYQKLVKKKIFDYLILFLFNILIIFIYNLIIL